MPPLEIFLAAERRAEAVRRTHAETEAARHRGVHHSGFEPAPFAPRTEAQIEAAAAERVRKAQAFAESPRGRLLYAIAAIERRDPLKGDRLRGIYSRDIAMTEGGISRELGGALVAILSHVPGQAARTALDAVAEMLMIAETA